MEVNNYIKVDSEYLEELINKANTLQMKNERLVNLVNFLIDLLKEDKEGDKEND